MSSDTVDTNLGQLAELTMFIRFLHVKLLFPPQPLSIKVVFGRKGLNAAHTHMVRS